jgi:hypothetical protein
MRSLLPAILGGLLIGLTLADRAAADTVYLSDGGYLTGTVEGSELTVRTEGGPVKVAVGDLRELVLGTLGGDLVRDRTGRTSAGQVEQGNYTVRLASGQSVTLARAQVSKIIFRGR